MMLIRFASVSSHVADFNTRNQILTAKFLKQGYRYHKLRKKFLKFYRRHCWISVAPAFQSWFAVEYSSCFISVMNLDLYVRCFDFIDE